MPDLRGLLADPEFNAMPLERRVAILGRVNPQLASDYARTRQNAQPEAKAAPAVPDIETDAERTGYSPEAISALRKTATIGELPGFGTRMVRHAKSLVSGAGQLSPAYRLLSGEGVTPAFTESLKSWLALGGNLVRNAPEVVTAPARDVGTLIGLEPPPGVSPQDPAEAVVNLAANLAPEVRLPAGLRPSNAATFLRGRAKARMIDLQRVPANRAATAEDIALEIAEGTPGLEGTLPGIGVGTRKQLAERARARQAVAGQEQEMLTNIDTPVNPGAASAALRAEAASKVTTPPTRTQLVEESTGLLDEAGDPIMGTVEREVPGRPATQDPALVSALEDQASFIDDLTEQYGGQVPAGELFRQRGVAGARTANAYQNLPGNVQAAGIQASKAFRSQLTKTLRDQLPEVPVAAIDRSYRVWRNAAVNFERSRLSALTSRGWQGLRDLLVGRLAGTMMGAAADVGMGGYGVGGALVGAALGESALWQSLRADTYVRLARLLNSGEVNAAADLLAQAGAASQPAGRVENIATQAERNRKARRALNQQAEGVVAP